MDCYGYNSLIVWHKMTGVSTGGYVSIENRYEQGTAGIAHPATSTASAFGIGVQAEAATSNYVSIYRGVSRYVGVKLNRTDGTHNVWVQPVNL